MRRLALGILLLVVGFVAVLVLKAALAGSRQLDVSAVVPVRVEAAAAADRLARAVQFRTVSERGVPDANAAEFAGLRHHLETSYPRAHELLESERVAGMTRLYTWRGSDRSARPIALLAHQDVVPIAPGTEGQWQHPPFDGTIADGHVWGRGTWDNKGNLIAIMEAVELLAQAGFQPRRSIHFVFGHDEEVGGEGAAAAAATLRERGVRLEFVLDEGLLITEGMLQGLARPAALIGTAEKGYLTLRLTATGEPGHASMPPPGAGRSAVGALASALARLDAQPLPATLDGLPRTMLETLAPEMSPEQRLVLANLWLTGPLVERRLLDTPNGNAMLRTTTALTRVVAGQAENVLPGRADALVNFRLRPGDDADLVTARVRSTIDDASIHIERVGTAIEPSRVSSTSAHGYQAIARSLRELQPDVVVAPGLLVAATDARHFEGIADDVYRFSPVRARAEDLARFHGSNERLAVDNLVQMIQFYHRLLQLAAGPAPDAGALQ